MEKPYYDTLINCLEDPDVTLQCEVTGEILKQGLNDPYDLDSGGYVITLWGDVSRALRQLLREQKAQTMPSKDSSLFDDDGDVPAALVA